MKRPAEAQQPSPSELIDARIRELADWRGEMLSRLRRLVLQAEPGMVEEWKWRGVPVWYHNGMICTGESYKQVVKVTFAKGASLEDPAGLFNASLEGNVRRAIDFHEGDTIDEEAFTLLVQAAAALNAVSQRKPAKSKGTKAAGTGKRPAAAKREESPEVAAPVLLSGGNPQIAKGVGDMPVQAYIEAMPSWKRVVGRRLDALIMANAPNARKAVKWNSPFYGIVGQGWFVSFHTFTDYVKVSFFQGTSLQPMPPGGTGKEARWINVHKEDLDEAQLAAWVQQAAAQPGWLTADIQT